MPGIRSRSSPNYPLRTRKTITFDGTAGNGAVGTVALFTITGQVLINAIIEFCSTGLAGATATISLGIAANATAIHGNVTATTILTGDFLGAGGRVPSSFSLDGAGVGNTAQNINKAIAQSLIFTVGTANITGGVMVVDVWYTPISSGGLLT